MFALLSRVAYEGDAVLGLYSSREAAESAWADFRDADDFGRMVISEFDVDAPATFSFSD